MSVGEDLMEKYPIGVSYRIAKEIDDAVRQAVAKERDKMRALVFFVSFTAGLITEYVLRN